MRWRTKQQSKHLVLQERNAHAGTPSHWPPKCPKCGESPPERRLARVFPAAHTQQARDSYPLATCPRLPTSRLLTEPGGPKPGPVPSAQCPGLVLALLGRRRGRKGAARLWVIWGSLNPRWEGRSPLSPRRSSPRIHRQGGALAASSGPTLGFYERQRQRQATGG